MKEIYVLRHAKSSWDNSNLSDFERPLANRGISDAKKMSKFLKDMDLKIDKVLCSNALRAKETFDLTADGFNFEIDKATYTDKLYFGDTTNIKSRPAVATSPTRALSMCGYGPGSLNIIDFVEIATTGNAVDFGDTLEASGGGAACSSGHGGL